MAQGDVVFFDQFLVDVMKSVHDLVNDEIKLALVTSTAAPAANTPDPRWGSGGSTNLSSHEVAAGGNYTSGGVTLSNKTVTLDNGAAKWDADDPAEWAQHASNPTNAAYATIYNNTDSGKRAIGFIDLGGAFDMTTGPLKITFAATGIGRLDQA